MVYSYVSTLIKGETGYSAPGESLRTRLVCIRDPTNACIKSEGIAWEKWKFTLSFSDSTTLYIMLKITYNAIGNVCGSWMSDFTSKKGLHYFKYQWQSASIFVKHNFILAYWDSIESWHESTVTPLWMCAEVSW